MKKSMQFLIISILCVSIQMNALPIKKTALATVVAAVSVGSSLGGLQQEYNCAPVGDDGKLLCKMKMPIASLAASIIPEDKPVSYKIIPGSLADFYMKNSNITSCQEQIVDSMKVQRIGSRWPSLAEYIMSSGTPHLLALNNTCNGKKDDQACKALDAALVDAASIVELVGRERASLGFICSLIVSGGGSIPIFVSDVRV